MLFKVFPENHRVSLQVWDASLKCGEWTFLSGIGCLVNRKRAMVTITEYGRKALSQNPRQTDIKFLSSFPKYLEYKTCTAQQNTAGETPFPKHQEYNRAANGQKYRLLENEISGGTPHDVVMSGYKSIRNRVESELLEKITGNSPEFFESLVLELIRKMGYGIEHEVRGGSCDGGVDGIILEDKLGFGEIYFQARGGSGTVPIHQIRDFAGVLTRKKSRDFMRNQKIRSNLGTNGWVKRDYA